MESKQEVLSVKDRYSAKTVRDGTRALNPGHEVPLPWKPGQPQLGNNRQLALQRLASLTKRFAKDPEYEKE